jgi:hypothetical protein
MFMTPLSAITAGFSQPHWTLQVRDWCGVECGTLLFEASEAI